MKKALFTTIIFQIALLIGILYISYLEVSRYYENSSRVLHSQEVIRTLNRIQIDDLEAQGSVRGYIISKEPKYIESFKEASDKIISEDLVGRVSDNPEQQSKAKELVSKLAIKRQFREDFILNRKANADLWMKIQDDPRGEPLTKELKVLFENFRSEELRLLNERNKKVETDVVWLRILASFVLLMGFLLVGTGYYLVFLGLKESKRLEKELLESKNHLESINKELEQFVYIASHDLQQPLRNIRSYCELLQMKYSSKLDETANSYINTVISGTTKMSQLIKDLLQYSRSGKIQEMKQVNTKKLVEEILEELPKAKIKLQNLPVVRSDENSIRQIFQNLLSNAIKFSKDPAIEVNSETDSDFVLFSVKDNGIGINMEYKDKIFEAFQRISNDTEGSGIGLAIVKKTVEKLGGKVWVESELDKGSTFYFTIKR